MKAIEILYESKKINEAPANIIGQGLKRLGAGVLGAMGAPGMAGSLAGSADAGAKANELFGNFKRYLGQIGKDKNTATVQDLEDYLVKNKLSTKLLKTTPINSWKDIDKFFTAMAQDSFKRGGGASSTKSSASPASAGTAPQASAQPAQSAAAPAGTAQGTSGASQNQVPKMTLTQIKQAVSGLRTRDKQSLIAFLQQGSKQPAKPAATTPAANPAQTPATAEPAADKAAAVNKVATTAKDAGVDPVKAVKGKQQAPAQQAEPAQPVPDETGRVEPTMEPATKVKPNTPALDKVRSGKATPTLNKVRSRVAAKTKKSNPASSSVAV